MWPIFTHQGWSVVPALSAPPPIDHAQSEGYLELGRPPEDLLLELEPIAAIAPAPGTLVLFPSFLYHGTRPFPAGERLSVAFDAR